MTPVFGYLIAVFVIVVFVIIALIIVAASHASKDAIMQQEINNEEIATFPRWEENAHMMGDKYTWNSDSEYIDTQLYFNWENINEVVYDPETGYCYIDYDYTDQLDLKGPNFINILIPKSMEDKFLELYIQGNQDMDYEEPLYRIEVTLDRGWTHAELMPY